jgi:hypothetical protein
MAVTNWGGTASPTKCEQEENIQLCGKLGAVNGIFVLLQGREIMNDPGIDGLTCGFHPWKPAEVRPLRKNHDAKATERLCVNTWNALFHVRTTADTTTSVDVSSWSAEVVQPVKRRYSRCGWRVQEADNFLRISPADAAQFLEQSLELIPGPGFQPPTPEQFWYLLEHPAERAACDLVWTIWSKLFSDELLEAQERIDAFTTPVVNWVLARYMRAGWWGSINGKYLQIGEKSFTLRTRKRPSRRGRQGLRMPACVP